MEAVLRCRRDAAVLAELPLPDANSSDKPQDVAFCQSFLEKN